MGNRVAMILDSSSPCTVPATWGHKIQYRATGAVEANTREPEVMGSNINDSCHESRFQQLETLKSTSRGRAEEREEGQRP